MAYLNFIDNSIYYVRFNTIINGKIIKGKYLDEKVNKWTSLGIFEKMFKIAKDDYKKVVESDIFHIDGNIITNKLCSDFTQLGRNTQYKSKKSINLQTVVDNNGIPLGFNILKGSYIKN